jgi:ABC-type sugar transport system ATPase subunit/ribose/xylose/arabinose/galactoside ABC-type transport system permease subunit
MNDACLQLDRISKHFPGNLALNEATLTVHAGEIHALMGANGAGKSTLMNVLGGLVPKDSGQIYLDGRMVEIRNVAEAAALKIAFVHQELNMLPTMTVAENIFIGSLPSHSRAPTWVIDRKEASCRANHLLQRLGCQFTPDELVENLSTGDRQMVEIARAIKEEPRIIIFDEPTSSLTGLEKHRLFGIIRLLKAHGSMIIYITHFTDEVFEICDRITVMRNGQTVSTGLVAEFSPAEIVRQMIGDPVLAEAAFARSRETVQLAARQKQILVQANGISRRGVLKRIDLTLHVGEIVGLWGLLGSGRTELARALLGLDAMDSGELFLRNVSSGVLEPVSPAKLRDATGFVTEDRRGEGLFLPLSVAENISLPSLARLLGRAGLISRKRERSFSAEKVNALKVKVASLTQPVGTLSGGNQQKVVLARWLATEPRLFLFDEPTRGVDVLTKAEILNLASELARAGKSVLLICSEIDEIMRISHRYLVLRRGEIVQDLPRTATREELMVAATGSTKSTRSSDSSSVDAVATQPRPVLAALISRLGFWMVLVFTGLFFSLTARHFATIDNILAMLHTMAPLVAISSGMALLALSGKLDISVGSVAFVSTTLGVLAVVRMGLPIWLGIAISLGSAAIFGMLNGLIVVGLQVNPLIATLGTMIALRGIGLDLTNASVVPLPEVIRRLGNLTFGPVFVDTILIGLVLLGMHFLHTRTRFGRQVTAIGNGERVAEQLGIPVRRVTFLSFILSALVASLGGLASLLQVGSLSGYLGKGLEFTAVAVVVVGGVSLFGGRGSFLPGVVAGAATFEMIENGLNQIGANPYVYRLVTGAVIFIAMYADALSRGALHGRSFSRRKQNISPGPGGGSSLVAPN